MTVGSAEAGVNQRGQAHRERTLDAGWLLAGFVNLGAVAALAATPALDRLPLPFVLWAAAAIALGPLRDILARRAAPAAARAPLLVARLEAAVWATGLAAAALVAPGHMAGTVVAAGVAALVAPLVAAGPPPHAARTRAALLTAGIIGGGLAGGAAAGLALYPLVALLGAGLWLGIGRRQRALAWDAARARAREETDGRVCALLDHRDAQCSDWTWSTDPEGRLRGLSLMLAPDSRALADLAGDTALAAQFAPGEDRDALIAALARGEEFRDLPLRLAVDGAPRRVALSGQPVLSGDGGWHGHGSFLEDRLPVVERIARMVETDPLTRLLDRHALIARLRAIVSGESARERQTALFVIDLDGFSAANDAQGSEFGDALLRIFAERLTRDSRDGDLVARLDGNRFTLAVEAVGGDSLLIGRAHRLLAIAREPFDLAGATIRLSASVGLARSEPGMSAPELLRRAEMALHGAKAQGRDRMALYEDALDRGARDRRVLEDELGAALTREELTIRYQPVIALGTGDTVAFEALVRWNHPTRGVLGPDQFLPVAEESGLIVALGGWILRRALEDVRGWDGSFRLAINLSPSQTRDPRLAATIEGALAVTGFPAARLELEITEQVLLDDADRGRRTLERLRALGIRIALDDFGTGYSSLSYLRRFRFDRVKIDRSFVSDLERSDEACAIVSTITRLAQALDMETTAEGVENSRQLDLLRKLGCDEAQGFFIHHPADAEAIAAARRRGEAFPGATAQLAAYRAGRAGIRQPGPPRAD